jgi:RimJ/RimL family protein N-acetyltransferase
VSQPFPTPLLTERLIIRAPAPEDAPALSNAIAETFDQLKLWMPWAQSPQTLDESRGVIDRMISKWIPMRDYVLFCFDRQTGEFVMAGGLHPVNLQVPSFHIGYWCRTSYQGKGYVTESVKAIRDAGFEIVGAKRIEIRCDARNSASRAVAERCGFPLEATMRNDCRDNDGALQSTAYYALTRDE